MSSKNIVNRKFVRVKGPITLMIPSSDGDDIPIILDKEWMAPLTALAKETNTTISRYLTIEGDTEVLLEFPTSKQAMIYALHYDGHDYCPDI